MQFIKDFESKNKAAIVMKSLAAVLIVISHCDDLFPANLKFLCSGGAYGDALFFFCSGFTLFLGRDDGFEKWYGRRVTRILPTVLVWAFLSSILGVVRYEGVLGAFLMSNYWFLQAIFGYYLIFYFIRHYFSRCLNWFYVLWLLVVFAASFSYGMSTFRMYGGGKFLYIEYFGFMLLGASVGKNAKTDSFKMSLPSSIVAFLACSLCYYGLLFVVFKGYVPGWERIQLLSLIPLIGVIYFIYRICNQTQIVRAITNQRVLGRAIYFVSVLTLEIYLCNRAVLSNVHLPFPANFAAALLTIIISAYLLHVATAIVKRVMSGDCDGPFMSVCAL